MTAADVCAEFEIDGLPVLDELSGIIAVYSDHTLLEAAFAGLATGCHGRCISAMTRSPAP